MSTPPPAGRRWPPCRSSPTSGSQENQNRRSGPRRGACPINPVGLSRPAQYALTPECLPTNGLLTALPPVALPSNRALGTRLKGPPGLWLNLEALYQTRWLSGTMSMRTLPLLFLNLGGEMLYTWTSGCGPRTFLRQGPQR